MSEMSAVSRAFVEGFAIAHGLRAQWEGEIGFGRECVGLLEPNADQYVAWEHFPDGVQIPDAYHKSEHIAVLGRGPEAEIQLAGWCRAMGEQGFRFESRRKEIPDLASYAFGVNEELVAFNPGKVKEAV